MSEYWVAALAAAGIAFLIWITIRTFCTAPTQPSASDQDAAEDEADALRAELKPMARPRDRKHDA